MQYMLTADQVYRYQSIERGKKKKKNYAVRRHDRSLCTQKQREIAALSSNQEQRSYMAQLIDCTDTHQTKPLK